MKEYVESMTAQINTTDFGDANARSGEAQSRWFDTALITTNSEHKREVFVRKSFKEIQERELKWGLIFAPKFKWKHELLSIDESGQSTVTTQTIGEYGTWSHLLKYEDCFVVGNLTKAELSIWRNNAKLFVAKQKILQNKSYFAEGAKGNYNRNVRLENHMLYFIDTNCDIIQYNLKELLSLDETARENYQPTVTKGPFETLCVCDNRMSTLTKEGLLKANNGSEDELTVDLSKLECMDLGIAAGGLGTQFGTLETLAGYFVVASYDPTKKQRIFSVLTPKLTLQTALSLDSVSVVQNMLLFEKNRLLHIVAAINHSFVDILVVNGDKIHVIQTVKVSSYNLAGVCWLKENAEVLVLGCEATLKSIRL